MRNILSVIAKCKSKYKSKSKTKPMWMLLFALAVIVFVVVLLSEPKLTEQKEDISKYEYSISTTKEEIKDFVYNTLTDMPILNEVFYEYYSDKISEAYSTEIKVSELLKSVVVLRELVSALNKYLYRSSNDRTEERFVSQQSLLEDIIINKKTDDNVILTLYSQILNLYTLPEIESYFTDFIKQVEWTSLTPKEKLEMLIIKHQVFKNKVTYVELKTVDYQKLPPLERIEYVNILIEEIKYVQKIFKNPYKDLEDAVDTIVTSKYPNFTKIEYISSIVNYDVAHNDSENNRNIREKITELYDVIDKQYDLRTYQSYLNLAFVFKRYHDVDYTVSYLLDAFDLLKAYPVLKRNYFTMNSIKELLAIYIASYDYHTAAELYKEYESLDIGNHYFGGKYLLGYSYKNYYAYLLFQQDKYKEGVKYTSELLDNMKGVVSKLHPQYIDILNLLAVQKIRDKDYLSGISYLEEILKILKEKKLHNTEQYLQVLTNYAVSLEKSGRDPEAQNTWIKVYKLSDRILGPGAPLIKYSKDKAKL